MFEKFVAKRYMKAKRRLSFITIISRVSMLGVSVGVAALIVVLAVFNGFGSLAKKLMLSAEPHLQIKFSEKPNADDLRKAEEFLSKHPETDYFYRYAEGKVIIGNDKHFEILTLKAVEDKIFNSRKFGIKRFLTNKLVSDDKKIYIALTNAVKLNARLGEKLKLTTFQSLEKAAALMSPPKVAELTLAGIFSTPNNELNANMIFADLKDVKYLFSKKNRLSGIDVFLHDYKMAAEVKNELLKLGLGKIRIETWQENHKQLFNMMKLERLAAFILLALIIAVASFNILSSLTMSVTVKQKDIAVMRAFGVKKNSIKKIFMLEGLFIGLKGTLIGFVLGMAIYFAQLYFKIYSMDPTKYVIDALPVKLDFTDVAATLIVSVTLAGVSAIYPARQAVKTNVAEAIKWE